MGLLFMQSLPGPKVFKCRFCRVDSASPDDIVSKEFRGRHGRAYLFDRVVNVSFGPDEDRYLLTGLHTVNDIYCSCCQRLLGWKYTKAYNEDQKYKEGKYILEKNMMLKEGPAAPVSNCSPLLPCASRAPKPDAAAPRAAPHQQQQQPGGGGRGHGGGRGGVRGGGPDGAVRAVRGRAGARVGEEGVPRVRPGGGDRGGVEPRAAARPGGPGPRHGGPPPRRGEPPPLAPPRAHHRLPQGLARPRRRRAQLHHRGLHLREPPRVPQPPQARLRQGAQEVGAADPRGTRPPPHPRPLHHPPRSQLQQRLHQWQHRPGQDRRPRAGGDRGQDPRGAHDPGHAGVHGAGAVHGDVHGVGGHLLVRHVRAGDGDAGDAIRRVRERRADLPQRHPRRAPRRAQAPQGPRAARLHRALYRPAPEPPRGRRAPAGPLLLRHRRRHHRHAKLARAIPPGELRRRPSPWPVWIGI